MKIFSKHPYKAVPHRFERFQVRSLLDAKHAPDGRHRFLMPSMHLTGGHRFLMPSMHLTGGHRFLMPSMHLLAPYSSTLGAWGADGQNRFSRFRYTGSMTLEFSGDIWYWKGPAPFYFVTVPAELSRDLKAASKLVTYGWGMIPVKVQIGETEWKTSLFPKDELYIVPIRADIRKAENLSEGDQVKLRLELGL